MSVGVSLRPPWKEDGMLDSCQVRDGLGSGETHLEGLGQRRADGGGEDNVVGILGGAARRKMSVLIRTTPIKRSKAKQKQAAGLTWQRHQSAGP